MNLRSSLVVAIVAGLILGIPGIAGAAGKGKAQRKITSMVWVVSSIDTNSTPKTIMVELTAGKKKETKTFELAATTEILVNGVAAKLQNVKVGMRAEFTLAEGPGFVLAQLKVSDAAPVAAAAAEQPKKAKKKQQ